ncbi:XdhC family aldehyde oxidoreductase maturation factor [Terrisporobacter glycolicus]|uniref:XdhC family aldehyde oxidoreductase maturation factor n=1 Tax=Terrisporobacter glycolicus TaxID=36841 RepID=UPI000B0B36CB
MNIYEEGLSILRDKKSFVLASIVRSNGSTPRSKGTQMIIREDGSIFSTVGGGKMEASCIEKGVRSIKNKETFIYEFNLDNKDANKSEMVCGGNGEILINYMDCNDDNNLLIMEKATEAIKNHKKGWIVTVLKKDKKEMLFVDDKNNLIGQYSGSQLMRNKLENGIERLSIHSDAIDDETFIVQKVHNMGKAYIFGAGHVSKETAAILDIIEFETIVLDDRSEFANKERFPNSETIVLDSLEEIDDLGIDEDSYILIITRGHLYDYNVLNWALKTDAYYIGMIGSKSKINMTYEKLKKDGFTEEDFKRVHAPIGIKLDAKTPGEIAVSIAGELINERGTKERRLEK